MNKLLCNTMSQFICNAITMTYLKNKQHYKQCNFSFDDIITFTNNNK